MVVVVPKVVVVRVAVVVEVVVEAEKLAAEMAAEATEADVHLGTRPTALLPPLQQQQFGSVQMED